MTRVEILYLLPYLFSLALSLWITIYAWRHRQVQGAGAYALLNAVQSFICIGFILELLSPDLIGKLFWDKIQWVGFSAASLTIPNFAVRYTDYKFRRPKLFWGLASILPACLVIGILTDPWTHLIYRNPILNQVFIFGELQYKFTWFVYLISTYSYLLVLMAFIILSRRIAHSNRRYRAQVTAVIIGLLIPVLGTLLALLGIQLTPLRDTTPITTAIGNMIIAWSIFRYRWLNIVHIARDKVVENMNDLVFVLDDQDQIIDINAIALKILDLKPSQVIGKPAVQIFSEWPRLIEDFREPAAGNHEIILERDGNYYHFDVKATVLQGARGNYQGRIFVARDITSYAVLQWQLKELNEGLEKRVKERTEELAEAYDRTLEGWAKALELRDQETEGHSRRVTDLTIKLAMALNVPSEEFDHYRRGAILHDIGKMAVPDEILRKPGQLTEEERAIIKQHPDTAHQLLKRIPFLKQAMDIPYCHHEKWDGSGYPRGLKGEEIPLAARIFSVVDVWDAVQSERPYNHAWSRQMAIDHLKGQRGKYFDPQIVDVFLSMVQEGMV
jgi:putative nucleotidyltransferase with HDIG domain/PAS domain S-box-containing protein